MRRSIIKTYYMDYHLLLRTLSLMVCIIIISCNGNNNTKIGVLIPLTGELASYGKSAMNAINLVVDENPSFEKIEFIFEDTRIPNEGSINSLHKLINIYEVEFIIGPLTSFEVLMMIPILNDVDVLMISPSVSFPLLSENTSNIIRIIPCDDYESLILGSYAVNELQINEFAILYVGNIFGINLKDKFENTVNSLGADVIFEFKYDPQSTFSKEVLINIEQKNPSAILLIGNEKIGNIIRVLDGLNIASTIFCSSNIENPDVLDVAGKSADNIIYASSTFNLNSDNKITNQFINVYKNKYENNPNYVAALAYDATQLLLQALKYNNYNTKLIKEYILSIKDYEGVTGSLSFDKNGDCNPNYDIKIIKNGTPTILSKGYILSKP